MLEEGVLLAVQQEADVAAERGDPAWIRPLQAVRQGDECVEVPAGSDRPDLEGSVQMTPSSRPIFANASSAKSI